MSQNFTVIFISNFNIMRKKIKKEIIIAVVAGVMLLLLIWPNSKNQESLRVVDLLEMSRMFGNVYKERKFHRTDTLPNGNISFYGYIPPWLPECDDIYLDLGSNIGVMVRKLFEPSAYPLSKALGLYNRTMNHLKRTGSKPGLCALGFEPNPKHYKRLQAIQTNYSRNGWKAHFFPFAISDKDEIVTFYTDDNSIQEDIGATVFKKGDKQLRPYQVKAIRFSTFLKTVLKGKQIKLAKMDIEGSEYNVLVDMLEYGLLCQEYIKTMFIEFHDKTFFKTRLEESPSSDLLAQIHAQACHVTEMVELDDETYLHDRGSHLTASSIIPCIICYVLAKTTF